MWKKNIPNLHVTLDSKYETECYPEGAQGTDEVQHGGKYP